MFEKLEAVEKKYEELTKIISDPEVIANQTEWQKAMKEHASMEEIVLKFREYKKIKQSMEEAEELMQDPDMKELAEEEYYASKEKLPKLEEELKVLLIPKDPDDDKNIICEIRAGAGGEEAALFAGTLFRMYTMYAEKKHWKLEILNENETGLGGEDNPYDDPNDQGGRGTATGNEPILKKVKLGGIKYKNIVVDEKAGRYDFRFTAPHDEADFELELKMCGDGSDTYTLDIISAEVDGKPCRIEDGKVRMKLSKDVTYVVKYTTNRKSMFSSEVIMNAYR